MKNVLNSLLFAILFSFSFLTVDAATLVVDRLDDVAGASACTPIANDCSLRGAIINANANGVSADTIQFNVGGGNAQTLTLTSTPLPDIQSSLTIDGTTQPLWAGLPLIEINGVNSTANTNGFRITSPVSNVPITVTIKGLIINRFQGSGIYFNAGSGVDATVTGCYIGTSAGGGVDLGNGSHGIHISVSHPSTFTIGGFSSTSERNVISGNQESGIYISTPLDIFNNNTSDVFVYNNFIGTNSAGNTDLGNADDGIRFGGLGFNSTLWVGTGTAAARNIISGNDNFGIWAESGFVNVYGNYIGTSLSGNVDLGNALDGIALMSNVNGANIGGTLLGFNAGNLISGNNLNGISITDASIPANIRRNLIGTNAAGTSALGNAENGIYLSEPDAATASSIVIGSTSNIDDGNTISGNGGDGIDLEPRVNNVKIYANKIGLNVLAGGTIPNTLAGIRVLSADNEIGLADNNIASNFISGNSDNGLMLVGANCIGNTVFNNYIGTNSSGANVGNQQSGIYLNQAASDNQIGNGTTGGGNKIASNVHRGINASDGQRNSIRGNSIYSNGELGIDLSANGVTLNDNNDADTGSNALQNFPVIESATPTRITGIINSIPSIQYKLDFYSSPSCDSSGHGEGQTYLGSGLITTSVNGTGSWAYTNQFAVTAGQVITATATDNQGNTSEFSACFTATPPLGDVSFSAASYTTAEAAGQRTIVVNRSGGTFGTISVDFYTYNSTALAGQDYFSQIGTLTFNNGEFVKSFNVQIINDTTDEFDEDFYVVLHNPSNGVFIINNQSPVTILDDDAPPVISIEDNSQFEGNLGNLPYSFRVSLSAPSGKPVSVDYQTNNGSATATQDFVPTSGTVNFSAGETLKNVVVDVIGDLTTELDETFTVDLSNPQNGVFGDNQGLGTIKDDDNPGKFSFSFAPYSGTEHDLVMVTVSRTNGTAGTVSVDYASSGGTATPLTDYTPVSGTLIFGDGETTKTFLVSLTDDATPEPAETINLVLSNPIGGATLGNPLAAVLTIIDNDNGTLLTLAGEVIRSDDHSPVANATVRLQGTQNAITTTDTNGRYSFPNLAPNGDYSVTPSALGYTFNPISQQFNDLSADNFGVDFLATAAPSRQLRIVGGNATPGQNVPVTVELVAQGDENSVGFSLNFDQTVLSNPQVTLGPDALPATLFVNNSQVANGKLGILLGMPAGQSFSVGTKSLVTITFNTAPTLLYNSPVTFGDVPLAREVSNVNADALTTNYLDGAVTFAQGYEADVAPRPTGSGNGSVTVADFTEVGRFVSGLDTFNPNFNEFQRADCAPRISLGNGSVTVSDFTQAGRYASGLDIVNPAGGAAIPSFASVFVDANDKSNLLAVPTSVYVANSSAVAGSQVVVSIMTDAQGTENGFGFTLNFDASKLSNPLILRGSDTQNATLIPNTTQTGRAAVVLAMPFGQAIAPGARQLVTVKFDVNANAPSGPTPLVFGDSPAFREVSDIDANVLDSSFVDGAINILSPTAATVSVGGRVFDANGNAVAKARVSVIRTNGEIQIVETNAFGYFRFDGLDAGDTYTFGVNHKFLHFTPKTLSILEAVEDLNFTANPD